MGHARHERHETRHHPAHDTGAGHYHHCLLAMGALSFLSLDVLMYATVDRLASVLPNFNLFSMAGLMTAPMVVIELALRWRSTG